MSEEDLRCQAQLSAFMERARWRAINRPHAKDTLDGKVDALVADLKHVHTTHESLLRGGGTGVAEVRTKAITSQRHQLGA